MFCHYCKNFLFDNGVGIFDCYICPIKIRYICSGTRPNLEVQYITFFFGEHTPAEYLIELSMDPIRTRLIKCNQAYDMYQNSVTDNVIIFDLAHLIDITPNTANHWLDKLLSLKTFS